MHLPQRHLARGTHAVNSHTARRLLEELQQVSARTARRARHHTLKLPATQALVTLGQSARAGESAVAALRSQPLAPPARAGGADASELDVLAAAEAEGERQALAGTMVRP